MFRRVVHIESHKEDLIGCRAEEPTPPSQHLVPTFERVTSHTSSRGRRRQRSEKAATKLEALLLLKEGSGWTRWTTPADCFWAETSSFFFTSATFSFSSILLLPRLSQPIWPPRPASSSSSMMSPIGGWFSPRKFPIGGLFSTITSAIGGSISSFSSSTSELKTAPSCSWW